MFEYYLSFLKWMRPAFSRNATWAWFVIATSGLILRSDNLGVTSIVRALNLRPRCYELLLKFFHSYAWSVDSLMIRWQQWLKEHEPGIVINNRRLFTGDHTKIPKDGRKIPAVKTLHQDSETGSKPSYFRGHHWGCIAMLTKAKDKVFSTPLAGAIHEGTAGIEDRDKEPKTTQLVKMAQKAAVEIDCEAYLILDAYFSVGPVFNQASEVCKDGNQVVHILTRAKKNIVAYLPAAKERKKRRGPKRKYGKKIKIMKIFDSKSNLHNWKKKEMTIYGKNETVRYLVLDLLWKPAGGMVRFILVESSRGRMILMSSDLELEPNDAISMYCWRVSIETMFDFLKNLLGGLSYHFWSKHLKPSSRKPKSNSEIKQATTNLRSTDNTLDAIEKFVNLQLCIQGMLQLIAKKFPEQVLNTANFWMRTRSSSTPSEWTTKVALGKVIKNNCGFGNYWINQLIKGKQSESNDTSTKKVPA
jgi:hypothetical protein